MLLPSTLWHCCYGDGKGIASVKKPVPLESKDSVAEQAEEETLPRRSPNSGSPGLAVKIDQQIQPLLFFKITTTKKHFTTCVIVRLQIS